MHRFILSHLQFSYPSSHPWYTENNLPSIPGRITWLKAISLTCKKSATSVSPLRRARKQHLSKLKNELSNLFFQSDSELVQRQNVSILCASKSCPQPLTFSIYPPLSYLTSPGLCLFHLRRWRRFFQPSTLTLLLTGGHQITSPKNLLFCSCTSSLWPFHSIICVMSFSICMEIWQHHCIPLKWCTNSSS